jgi:NADP-dependent 3-hydroxy acid dehydrogenase YdfG
VTARGFAGQTALLSGGSSGIGRAIALALAAAGAGLALIGRRTEALEAIAAAARQFGSKVVTYRVDLNEEADIRALPSRLAHEVPRLDVLVHAAGIIGRGETASAAVADLDRQYATNVRGPYVLTQALLPMLRRDRGQVVFLNSSAGLRAAASVGQYAATKHALKAIADSLRDEVNVDGVRVLSVFLGRTATPMQAAVHADEGRPYVPERLLQPEDVAAVVINALSLPHTAEVTDISIRPMQKS